MAKRSPARKTTKTQPAKKAAPVKRKTAPVKPARKPAAAAKKAARPVPDFSALPPGAVETTVRRMCLACVWALFTKQLKMAPRTALSLMKTHHPSVEELTAPAARPYIAAGASGDACPYCGAAKRRQALLTVHRIEGSRATDGARKALLEKLPRTGGQFAILEQKSQRQSVVFHWLEGLAGRFDFEGRGWLMEAARTFLEKRHPQEDWAARFAAVSAVRRSTRLESGWETQTGRLYLAPEVYDEVLLFQYVLSRSHRSGGQTFEGRLTIAELLKRLRRRGYFEEHEIEAAEPIDVLEQLVESLAPGTATVRLYYVVDRRDFLARLGTLKTK